MKDKAGSPSRSFHFDVSAQLVNIPATITLYELRKLSKTTWEVLWDALADAEVFATHVEANLLPKDPESFQTSSNFACIFFSPKDMQMKKKHEWPLYFTKYISSTEVNCIQVDQGSTLNMTGLYISPDTSGRWRLTASKWPQGLLCASFPDDWCIDWGSLHMGSALHIQ